MGDIKEKIANYTITLPQNDIPFVLDATIGFEGLSEVTTDDDGFFVRWVQEGTSIAAATAMGMDARFEGDAEADGSVDLKVFSTIQNRAYAVVDTSSGSVNVQLSIVNEDVAAGDFDIETILAEIHTLTRR